MIAAATHGDLHHLHSALDIPPVPDTSHRRLEFRRISFRDYIVDMKSFGILLKTKPVNSKCAPRNLSWV